MGRRGFTLIEMIVITSILLVMAALVTPNLVNMRASREVRTFINALPDIAGRARDTALSQGTTTKLTFDDASQELVVSVEKLNQDDQEVTKLAVPSQVNLTGFQADGQSRSSGDWTVRFYSDGRSDGGAIETSDAGRIRSLVIDRDGVAQLQSGEMPPMQDERWPAGDYERRTS